MNPHFKALEAAYQLHFYLCFKTHYLKPLLATNQAEVLVRKPLADVCERQQYHLLETEISDDHLRLLLSLQQAQTVSQAAKMLKGNLNQQFVNVFPQALELIRCQKLWARGYFARSSGKVDLERARHYVANQVSHHGYKGEWTKPLSYRNPRFKSPAFDLAHSFTLLNYHLVLATQNRIPVFDEAIATPLFNYVLSIGEKRGFAVERIGLLPDHMHLILEARPDVSIEDCARAILENTRYWMAQRYYGVLKETQAWDVWQPSFYAGTVGEYTTSQVKRFLRGGG
ncbi:MAG TPA: IS200/IS605 family transposase [Pyrinomonadaceae bacterium]